MKNIWLAGAVGAAAGILVSTQFAGPIVAQEAEEERSVYEQLDLFGDIFERVRSTYVEEVDEKDLIQSAINGMLSSLDPHSSYLPPDDFDDMRVQTQRRVRRARHRGDPGGRLREGRGADRGHPGRPRPACSPAISSPMWTARACWG